MIFIEILFLIKIDNWASALWLVLTMFFIATPSFDWKPDVCVSSIVVNIQASDKHRTLSIEITYITPTLKQMGVVGCVCQMYVRAWVCVRCVYVRLCVCVRACVRA